MGSRVVFPSSEGPPGTQDCARRDWPHRLIARDRRWLHIPDRLCWVVRQTSGSNHRRGHLLDRGSPGNITPHSAIPLTSGQTEPLTTTRKVPRSSAPWPRATSNNVATGRFQGGSVRRGLIPPRATPACASGPCRGRDARKVTIPRERCGAAPGGSSSAGQTSSRRLSARHAREATRGLGSSWKARTGWASAKNRSSP